MFIYDTGAVRLGDIVHLHWSPEGEDFRVTMLLTQGVWINFLLTTAKLSSLERLLRMSE